jgi:hypothetical protein
LERSSVPPVSFTNNEQTPEWELGDVIRIDLDDDDDDDEVDEADDDADDAAD